MPVCDDIKTSNLAWAISCNTRWRFTPVKLRKGNHFSFALSEKCECAWVGELEGLNALTVSALAVKIHVFGGIRRTESVPERFLSYTRQLPGVVEIGFSDCWQKDLSLRAQCLLRAPLDQPPDANRCRESGTMRPN